MTRNRKNSANRRPKYTPCPSGFFYKKSIQEDILIQMIDRNRMRIKRSTRVTEKGGNHDSKTS